MDFDEVDRAISRNGILPNSALEREVRREMFYILGDSQDSTDRDRKFDKFIREQRGNPIFEDSVPHAASAPSKESEPALNPLGLTPQEFSDVASGKIALTK